MTKITLKEAREKGKIDQFIREHENDAPGDMERLEKMIGSAAKTSSANRKASKPDASGD